MKIIWSETAKTSFAEILDFLEQTWKQKQLQDFYLLTEKTLHQIRKNPYQFKPSDKKRSIRKGFIHKNVSIYYQVHQKSKEIELLFFFDNRSQPTRF